MYGLHFREQLPQVVADELDGLVTALRGIFYKEHNEDGTHVDAAPEFALVPVGSVQAWLTSTPPDRWLICNGSAISRITYRSLFTVLGIAYGAGDGVLTFNLPDLRGRFLLGKAASGTGSTLGAVGGSIDHTHTGPSHTHTGPSHTHTGPSHSHTGATGGGTGDTGNKLNTTITAGPDDTTTVDNVGLGSTTTVASNDHVHEEASHQHAAGTHTHTISADGTGATGADGTGNTGSGGTGATGASNPPFIVGNWIVFAGGTA